MPLQPLNSAKQESDSASLSDVTLEGETAATRRVPWQRACSRAMLRPGREYAQEMQL